MRVREALPPSFRNRLRLFFVVIVIVPMIAVAVVLFQLVVESDRSQTDARLSEAQRVAFAMYEESRARAGRAAGDIAGDQQLADALDAGRRPAIQGRLDQLAMETRTRFVRLELDDDGTFDSGRLPAVAPARSPLVDAQNRPAGELTVSTSSAEQYAEDVSRLTGAEVVVSSDGETLATTLPDADGPSLPERGEADV